MKEATAPNQAVSTRPIAVYLLVWITLGFYAIYWYLRAVDFLNSVDKENQQNTRKIRSFVFAFLAVYISGVAYVYIEGLRGVVQPEQPGFAAILIALFLMALSWNVLVPVVLVRLAARLRRIQTEHEIDNPASPWRTLLAYFLWFVSFPYLQHHLNLMAEVKSDVSVQV